MVKLYDILEQVIKKIQMSNKERLNYKLMKNDFIEDEIYDILKKSKHKINALVYNNEIVTDITEFIYRLQLGVKNEELKNAILRLIRDNPRKYSVLISDYEEAINHEWYQGRRFYKKITKKEYDDVY